MMRPSIGSPLHPANEIGQETSKFGKKMEKAELLREARSVWNKVGAQMRRRSGLGHQVEHPKIVQKIIHSMLATF